MKTPKTVYKIINNLSELKTLIGYCLETGYCSFDFETSGHKKPFYSTLGYATILGVSFQPGSAWIIPLGHKDSVFKQDFIKVFREFGKAVLENPSVTKVCWNAQHEYLWCMKYGIYPRGRVLDGMLAKYLLDEERPNGLKEMVDRFLPEFSGYDLPGSGRDNFDWEGVDLEVLSKYCGKDADLTLRLTIFFEKLLIKYKFYPLYRNLLMMAVRTLADTTYKGMLVDVDYLDNLIEIYSQKLNDTEKELRSNPKILKYEKKRLEVVKSTYVQTVSEEIAQLGASLEEASDARSTGSIQRKITNLNNKLAKFIAGEYTTKKEQELLAPINFDSPKQLIDLFFTSPHGFKFKILKLTDSGKPSTDEETLLKLKDKDPSGFIDSLLSLRELGKLYSTYIAGMRKHVSHENKIHAKYLIHGTVTGRLSSRDPNFQNIPRSTTSADIKKMFIPPKGYLHLEVDYSQAELRVVAQLSQDKAMIEMFKSGYNVHVATAAKMAKVPYEELNAARKDENHPKHEWAVKMHKKAKTYNFGVLYGQTAKKLAETIAEATKEKPNLPEAEKGLKDWFKAFPGVKRWIDRQHREVKENGYVYNLFGRKRRLPKIYDPDKYVRLEAERQSVNAPIQGSASDFTQLSAIILRDLRMKGELPDYLRMVYTVHDSLGFYIKPKDVHWVVKKITEVCANPDTKRWFGFEMTDVNMKVSAEIGHSWGELHDYNEQQDYTKF